MTDESAVRTILIVDDEPHIVQVLSVVLRQAGFRALAAGDGLDALEMIRRHDIDLVVTDRHLPSFDGIELAMRLYVDARTRRIPLIVLSGFNSDPNTNPTPNVRATLSKPFSPRVVLDHIVRILSASDGAMASAA